MRILKIHFFVQFLKCYISGTDCARKEKFFANRFFYSVLLPSGFEQAVNNEFRKEIEELNKNVGSWETTKQVRIPTSTE